MYYLYPVKPLFAKTCEFFYLKSAAVYRVLDAKGSHVLTIVVVLGCFLCFFPIATTLRNGGNVLVPCWPSVSDVLFFFLFFFTKLCFRYQSISTITTMGNSVYKVI